MASQSNTKKNTEINKKLTKSNIKSNQKNFGKSVQKTSDSQTRHPTNAFIEKSNTEFKKLENKIADEFRRQLSDVFESENFSDTVIIRGKFQKRVHSCLLMIRVPNLFKQLLDLNLNRNAYNCQTNQYSVKIPPEIKEQELKLLLQKIYSDFSSDIMEKEENHLISKIEILNKNFITEEESLLISLEQNFQNVEQISRMESSVEFVSHSESHSDEEPELFGDNREDNSLGIIKTTQMIRSGTFELLSSIYSDDSFDINKGKPNENSDQLKGDDQNKGEEQNDVQMDSSVDKTMASNETSNKSSNNSMFSMFIDINEISTKTVENQRPKSERDDRKGFDFIPLNSKPANSQKPVANQKKVRNSAGAVLIRSVDSALPKIKAEDVDDIPLLPMSPIVRNKPENHLVKRVVENNIVPKNKTPDMTVEDLEGQCSSSDSFSEAFNECMNISVRSSSKNSIESDSIGILNENECKKFDNFIDDSDNGSLISDEGNDNSDLDFNDSETMRNMKSCSKLGDDLLKMFVQQINADIIIRVCDREIKAHKCILTSRCRYFEAMLSGNWIESDSNYVDLQGFSYNSVYFALCHIYSGCLTLPSKIDLSELALLSDILAMDSLKEIVVHELLVNRCHFFHTPCSDNCIVSIIKCMKLCSRSGLNDLYKRCLNWSAKHFTKVWNNKVFASLKPPLLEACLQTKVKQLLPESVLKTTLECERMITSIPRVKWAEPIFTLLARLIEETCNFIAQNYNTVITSKDFLALGRSNSWDISNLEQTLLAAMTKLSPDISCKALIELNKILLLQENEQNNDGFSYGPFNDKFGQLVTKMQRYCERYMIQNANRVVHSQSWSLLSNESQQKIRDGAVIVFEFDKPIAPPPKLSSRFKRSDTTKDDNWSDSQLSAKGAVPKNRSKTTANTRKAANNRTMSEQHIYDSVPFEDVKQTKEKPPEPKRSEPNRKEKVSNRALSLHLNSRQSKGKVAKVSPFTVKAQNFCQTDEDSPGIKDLVAEIDAETNLVTHCLQEAELLEQELTRKFQKTQNRTAVGDSTSSSMAQQNNKVGNNSKESNQRKTTIRSQSTSSPLKSRPLPRVAKTKENSRK